MPVVKKYPAEVVFVAERAPGTFCLEMRSLSTPFRFHPGQFLHLALDPVLPDQLWPDSRCFSIQSPPEEETLRITFSVKGNFTRKMADVIRPGTEVTLKLPYGSLFSLEHNSEGTVFISGGTGLTPFLSLFNSRSFAGYKDPVLYAGFRTEMLNIFTKELEKAFEINPGLVSNLIYDDQHGILDPHVIAGGAERAATYFISGPPAMISYIKTGLVASGVSLHDIRTDEWE